MPLHNIENSTLSAPNHMSQFTTGKSIDSSYDSSTKLGDTVAGIDSSSQESVLEQPDHGHSEILHTTKIKHVQSAVEQFICPVCGQVFRRKDDMQRHNRKHVSIPSFLAAARKWSPSVLLTELKDLDLAHILRRQDAPTGRDSGLSSIASGHKSALHLDPSDPLSIPRPQWRCYDSFSSLLEIQVMPSPPLPNILLTDIPTLLPDRPETSEDSRNTLVKAIPSGDEPDCEGFSRRIELSGHQIDSQGTSDSEGRSTHNVSHESKETTFAQERVCEKDGNSHLSDNSEGSLSTDERSSNSSSENGYNDTNERSVLNCSQRALISRLMDEICPSFFYQVSRRPRQHGQGGQGSRESSSSSTEQTTTTNSSVGEFPGSWRKRRQKEDEDPEDEDDGKRKRLKNKNSDEGHSTRVRYFACPFYKFDASTYGTANADPRVGLKYRSCGPPGWPNIGKLK